MDPTPGTMDRDRIPPPLLVALQQWITGDSIPTGIDLGVVVDQLLRDGSTEMAAAVGSVLERGALRIGRDGGDASFLKPLQDRVATELTERVRRDADVEDRRFEQSLGARMLEVLAERDRSPSELAGFLEVDITQVSRAGRVLAESGEMVIEVDRRDRRRRLYRARSRISRYVFRDVVNGALRAVRVADVASDLLPDRFGDRLTASSFSAVVAAARSDIDTASYEPTPAHRLDVPKVGGGERPAAALRYIDRLVYAALSEGCRPQIEAALGSTDQVLWPRGEFTDKQWVRLENFVAGIDTPYVLAVDIASFYESIHHQVLADQLLRAGCDQKVVDALRSWLGTVTGKDRGLPQGLRASDRLASIVLSPVDAALRETGLPFVRHGDDLRVAVATPDEARDVKSLVRAELRALDLLVNEDKTRWLRQRTYLEHRTEVAKAVERYLGPRNELGRDLAIYSLLDALGAKEELMWDWYHSELRVPEVICRVGANLEPGDEQALLVLLDAVVEEERRHRSGTPAHREDRSHTFLLQAGVRLLAVSGVPEWAARLPPWLGARPEYGDALSTYVKSVARTDPMATAAMLTRIEDTNMTYDAQWLRLYEALGNQGQNGEFDTLAFSHLQGANRDWTLRLRAARFVAERGGRLAPTLESSLTEAPDALREDVLGLVKLSDPARLPGLLNRENETAKALIAA